MAIDSGIEIALLAYSALTTLTIFLLFGYIIYLLKNRKECQNCASRISAFDEILTADLLDKDSNHVHESIINLLENTRKALSRSCSTPAAPNKYTPRHSYINEGSSSATDSRKLEVTYEKIETDSENDLHRISHQYETISEAENDRTKLLKKFNESNQTDENEKKISMNELKEKIIKNIQNAHSVGKNKEVQCNLYDETQQSIPMHHYEKVDEEPEDLYAKFLGLPFESLRSNKTSTNKGNKTKPTQSLGSDEHLKFFKPTTSQSSKKEPYYMEARSFEPKEDCPDDLRSLCTINPMNQKEKPPCPKRKRLLTEPIL